MSRVKGDRTPAPKKEEFSFDDFLADPRSGRLASVPKDDKDKYSFRWISWKQFSEQGGSHYRNWVPYKLPETARSEFTDPGGYIRHGSDVLAYRPKAMNERHIAYNKERAHRADPSKAAKRRSEELRQEVRSAGLDKHVNIEEGYDD